MTFESRKLPWERISSLVEILNKKGHAVGIEAHSGLSGLVAEKFNFDFIKMVVKFNLHFIKNCRIQLLIL